MELEGRVAVVTGSAVGIGRQIALALAREGASVAVNYRRSAEEAQQTAHLVEQAGGRAVVVQADVTRESDTRRLVKEAVDALGRLDILVNNAGATRFIPFDDLEAVTEEAWDALYDVNVKGAFFCARAAAPQMREVGGGSIINIASQSGLQPVGSSIPYSVSKAAMIHLTRCLAKVLAPDIRVNALAPGFVGETRWYDELDDYEARAASAAESTLMGRTASPQDVAEAAAYLAVADAPITGVVLSVDGGAHLL